jgi:hypothetical protein
MSSVGVRLLHASYRIYGVTHNLTHNGLVVADTHGEPATCAGAHDGRYSSIRGDECV